MSLYHFTAQITNVLAAGDDIVVWDPPSEEVDFYVVRIYFKNSLNNRAGTLSRNAPKNQPWLEILQTFTDPSPIQGVEYYFQVHAHPRMSLTEVNIITHRGKQRKPYKTVLELRIVVYTVVGLFRGQIVSQWMVIVIFEINISQNCHLRLRLGTKLGHYSQIILSHHIFAVD